MGEKQNAHDSTVSSVQFSPNGALIVAGSEDSTIKAWDAVNFRPHVESEWESFSKEVKMFSWRDDSEMVMQTWWRNKITGDEQAVKPSGSECMCP